MKRNQQVEWIRSQQSRMFELVTRWASINSGTLHAAGVRNVAQEVAREFQNIGVTSQLVQVPDVQLVAENGELVAHELGPVVSASTRKTAKRRVLLAIHTDTVYPADSTFQDVTLEPTVLRGPGVTDAKGGIAVMLIALEAFERWHRENSSVDFGWELLLNPDEEIGSPSSQSLLLEAAQRHHLGLLFEPALPDGNLAGQRKGSANFHLVVRGVAAHAGRHFHEGVNAIIAAADIALQIHQLNGRWPQATLNVAKIEGGAPSNTVPDTAIVRLNIRYTDRDHESPIATALEQIVADVQRKHGVTIQQHGTFTTPPKPLDATIQTMMRQVQQCGQELGLDLTHAPTGGVCDGNRLAAAGLPNIDTLGPRGGGIHSPNEFLQLDSLTERAALTTSLLIGWATQELDWPLGLSST